MELYLYICKFGGVCCCLTCGVFVVVWTLLTSPGGFGRSILIITPSKQEVRQQRVLIFIPRSSQTRPSRSVKSTKILETMAKEALQEEIFQHKVSKQKVGKDKSFQHRVSRQAVLNTSFPSTQSPKKYWNNCPACSFKDQFLKNKGSNWRFKVRGQRRINIFCCWDVLGVLLDWSETDNR